MAESTEVVFSGRDNDIVLELSDDNGVVDLASLTSVTVSAGAFVIDSLFEPSAFDWSLGNGQLRFMFGGLDLPKRLFVGARIITFDATNQGGIVWSDDFQFDVR